MSSLSADFDACLSIPGAQWEALLEGFTRRGLGSRAKPFARSLRPRLLPRALAEEINRKIGILAGAVVRFADRAFSAPALLDVIGLSPEERALAQAPAPPGIGLTRVDGFLEGDRFRIVEWNGGCPAGGAYLDHAAPAYEESPAFRAFAETRWVARQPTMPGVLENLLARYRAQGGQDPRPRIAVVDFAGLSTADEHALFRDDFARAGYPAEIVPPEALSFTGGRLLGPSGPIDIVYRRLVTRDYLPRQQEIPAVAQAALAGAATFVDPFRAEVIHKKSFFAILSDPQYESLYSPEERAVIRDLVPWTRRTQAQHTTDPEGRRVDLLDYAQRAQQSLVLKPTDSYGGKGVLLGWELTSSLWNLSLTEAFASGGYVLQERVATPRAAYPIAQPDGSFSAEELLEDLCPYLAESSPHGFLCRASSLSLGNVSAGAFAVPVFTVG